HLLHAVDDLDPAVGTDVGDHHVDRVGADVDSGEPHPVTVAVAGVRVTVRAGRARSSSARNAAVTDAGYPRGMRIVLLMLVGVLAAAVPGRAAVLVNGAGATFPYPIYSKWFDEFHKRNPDVQINYQSIGSGGGIRQVTEGTVDFGASDGPMTDEQLAQTKVPILHFPTVLGAVVPTYNLPGSPRLRLSGDVLAGIFLGRITQWNDPAIVAENPDVTLPAEPIVPVHRSDGSGTTYVFVDYLTKVSAE